LDVRGYRVDIINFIGLATEFGVSRYKKGWIFLHLSYTSSLTWKYIPAVESPPNHTSLPSMAATFLVTRLMAVLQPSRYSIFHGGDTPI